MPKGLKILIATGLIALGVMIGHNTNLYHGADQWAGVTWGSVGGCELGPNAGFTILGHNYTGFGCWEGISD